MLSEEELDLAGAMISVLPPGRYTARKLHGPMWRRNGRRPREFGKRFKAAVLGGDLPALRWVRQRSDRCQEYELLPATEALRPRTGDCAREAANAVPYELEEMAA